MPGRLKRPSRRPPPSPLMSVKDGIRPSKMEILIPTDSRLELVTPTRLQLDLIRPEATVVHHMLTTMLSPMRWTFPVPIFTVLSSPCSTWMSPPTVDSLPIIQFRIINWLDSLPLHSKHQVASPLLHPPCPFHLNLSSLQFQYKFLSNNMYKLTFCIHQYNLLVQLSFVLLILLLREKYILPKTPKFRGHLSCSNKLVGWFYIARGNLMEINSLAMKLGLTARPDNRFKTITFIDVSYLVERSMNCKILF